MKKANQLLAGGHKFACCELKGDWKWHERTLRLQDTPVSKRCCFLCDATADDGPTRYYDVGDDAGWIATEATTAGFIANKVRPGRLSHLDPWIGVRELMLAIL